MTAPKRHDDLPPDLLVSLQAAMAEDERGWHRVRAWSTPVRHATAMAVVLVITLAVLVATPRLDLAAYPRVRLIVSAAALVVAASFGLRRYLRPRAERRQRTWLLLSIGATLLLLPVVLALLPGPHHELHLHPESFEGTGVDFVPRAVACLVFGTLVAIPTLLTMMVMNRHADLTGARIALAAGVAGMAGTLGLLLHCPLVSIAHRLAGHGAVGLTAAALLAGLLLVIRRRRESRKSE